jgi:hypothetical protein
LDWGAHGLRGNFDPPLSRMLDRTKYEFCVLQTIFGLTGISEAIETNYIRILKEINREVNIAAVYDKRGKVI